MSMDDVSFDKLDVWIQVHGLSLGVCNDANARQIWDTVGRFLELEVTNVAQHQNYMRIRVGLMLGNLCKPVSSGPMIKAKKNGQPLSTNGCQTFVTGAVALVTHLKFVTRRL